jgi:hypothetical protein
MTPPTLLIQRGVFPPSTMMTSLVTPGEKTRVGIFDDPSVGYLVSVLLALSVLIRFLNGHGHAPFAVSVRFNSPGEAT